MAFIVAFSLLWVYAWESLKVNDYDVLDKGGLIKLRQKPYVFSLDSEYRLMISIEEKGEASLKLYDEKNNFDIFIRLADAESVVSFSQKNNNVTTILVDSNFDGIPDFRVITNEKDPHKSVKEKLRFIVEPSN